MGKTKTSFVSDSEEKKGKGSSFDAYKAKKEKQKLEEMKAKEEKVSAPVDAVSSETQVEEVKEVKKGEKGPKTRSEKYKTSKTKVESGKLYSVKEAVKLVKETSYSKFDGTVELHLVVKKTGTNAQVTLPHSGGKEKKIEVANEETLEKLKSGKVDFDVLLATADMMPKLVVFARILGPKGLMPNPKNGTIIKTLKDADKYSANSLSLKTEKEAPLMHMGVGKVSQKDEEVVANIEAIFKTLGGNKQIIKAYTKATMGPAIKLQVA